MATLLLLMAGLSVPLQGEAKTPPAVAAIHGSVTGSQDKLPLPGVEIRLLRGEGPAAQLVSSTVSDDKGHFALDQLSAGRYRIEAALPGFVTVSREDVSLHPGETLLIDFEMTPALKESVEVVGKTTAEVPESGTSEQSVKAELIDIAPVKGDDFSALMPLLPGVLRAADGRIVMKGGRPTQSSLVVNNSTNVTDPVTGDFGYNLPVDALEAVQVLPNPYSAEYGRFSSGVTNLITKQGSEQWKFRVNNFFPRMKLRDNHIMGIEAFTPRLSIRGPVVKDKVFLAQTLQYRVVRTRIPGLPPLQADTNVESFDSFSQFDFFLGERNTLTAVASIFPRKLDFANLDTFNPQEVTPNLHRRGYNFGLTERAILSPSAVLESTLSFKKQDVDIFGQGLDEMEIAPEFNHGNFFNTQRRNTRTWQWVESVNLHREGWGGEHLFKFGLDLLHNTYDGESESRPVNVRRADGTLSQRIEFSGPSSQRVRSTDLALFGQDRWRLNDRLLLELGLRLDRDGVLRQTNVAPRFGFVLGVLSEGKGIVRGGAGLFYDRTPLNVGAFESFEAPRVSYFGADGSTLSRSRTFTLVSADSLHTPYSFTWNLEYDQRLGSHLLLKTNYLRRSGFHEFLVDPVEGQDSRLRLDTRGRSRYWELELTSRYKWGEESHLSFSYVRSRSRQDLNAFDDFYGSFRNPIIRPNEYSLGPTDAPNRYLLQGSVKLPGKWMISPVLEIRDGFPYSLRNQDQDFVGSRNRGGRFPTLTTLDIDVQRHFRIRHWNTRIGFRFFNVLNHFNPRDVQGNIDALRFGTFSNQITRQFGITFQVEP